MDGARIQEIDWVRTIQKRDSLAKSSNCSMVERTLNIRQMRTMAKLWCDGGGGGSGGGRSGGGGGRSGGGGK